MPDAFVNLSYSDRIATIEFFHPAHNSLPAAILNDLSGAITEASSSEQADVVVLRSGGDRTFCAGASFDELSNIETEADGLKFFSGFANVINAMRTCPKFIVARVQGKAVGGGIGLAAASDYCFATQHAAIKLSELNVGIGPFVVGPAIERKIGLSAMSQIAIDASTFYSADWAMDKGLYTQVHDTIEELDQAISALTQQLKQYNPDAMAELKSAFWRGTEHWNTFLEERAAISGRLVVTAFAQNRIKQIKPN